MGAVVAFVTATVLMPSTAIAATPGAIPGNALPACTQDSGSGGWAQRDFASNGGSVDTTFSARVKGLRLNEPCLQTLSGGGPEISIPINVLDVYDDSNGDGMEWGDSAPLTSGEGTVPTGCHQWNNTHGYYLNTVEDGGPVKAGTCFGIFANGRGGLFVVEQQDDDPTPGALTLKWNSLSGGTNYFGTAYVCDDGGSNRYGYPQFGYQGEYFELSNKGASGEKDIDLRDDCGATNQSGQPLDNPTAAPRLVLFFGNDDGFTITTVYTYDSVPNTGGEPVGGDAGRTLNGEVASEIAVDGQGIMAPAQGYYVCSNTASGEATNNVSTLGIRIYDENFPDSMNDLNGEEYDPAYSETWHAIQDQPCPYLKEIHVYVCYYVVSGDLKEHKCTEAVWTYERYASGNSYGDTDLKDNACNTILNGASGGCTDVLYPDPNKPEPAINCTIEYSDPGNPITNIGEFFGGLGPFLGCLFTPQGWDRTNKITSAWTNGAVGKLTTAFQESVPDGIVCGEVATIPMLNGSSFTLNTCGADVAPTIVKTVIGWVIVLGTCALIIRRIMWSVGSRG